MAKTKKGNVSENAVKPPPDSPEIGVAVGHAGETTGRFVVIFKEARDSDVAAAKKVLRDAGGAKSIAASADFEGSAVRAEDLASGDGVYFNKLGIAVVSGEDLESVQSLSAEAADADSPILAIEPEYRAYALSTLAQAHLQYLRGYKDAVDHLFEQLSRQTPGGLAIEAAVAAAFQDTAQLTWGLQATRAHTSPFSGRGVKLAVLDTGLDLAHADFRGRAIVSQRFVAGPPGATVQDGNRHGTHCIGTACGAQQPASGVRRYGVAYQAAIYVGKVLNDQGSGATRDIAAGIEWALGQGCQVISMSLGANVDRKLQQYEVPIARALRAGTLVVAAAGNNANRGAGEFGFVGPPANADAALAVAAVDGQLAVANFSARSSTTTGDGGKVNLSGPGVAVFSSVPTAFGLHAALSGTSMATPHVAGIAALWCQATGERGATLWSRLERSARPLPGSTLDVGFGLVQAPQGPAPRT